MADQERERKRIDESNMNFRKLPPGQKPFSDMYTFDQWDFFFLSLITSDLSIPYSDLYL